MLKPGVQTVVVKLAMSLVSGYQASNALDTLESTSRQVDGSFDIFFFATRVAISGCVLRPFVGASRRDRRVASSVHASSVHGTGESHLACLEGAVREGEGRHLPSAYLRAESETRWKGSRTRQRVFS